MRRYSFNPVAGRNLFYHLDKKEETSFDEHLCHIEAHNRRLIELSAKGKESFYWKEIKRQGKNQKISEATMIFYEVEAKLMDDRAKFYVEAKAKGHNSEELTKTMREYVFVLSKPCQSVS